jgi:hypothetical protein
MVVTLEKAAGWAGLIAAVLTIVVFLRRRSI